MEFGGSLSEKITPAGGWVRPGLDQGGRTSLAYAEVLQEGKAQCSQKGGG